MNHQPPTVLEQLDAYLHGLLSPSEAARVERACAESEELAAALERAKGRKAALSAVPTVEASEELMQATIDLVEEQVAGRRRRWRRFGQWVLVATAASVLLIATAHLYYYRLAPSPYDVQLLGQQELFAGTHAAVRVAVMDRRSGLPARNVPVRLAIYDPDRRERVLLADYIQGEAETDAPRVELPDWEDGEYQLEVTARPGGGEEKLLRPIQLRCDWQLMLSTDKPVYQPGQTIQLRSLALRQPDRRPVAGEEVTFSITDPKGNVIFRLRDVTSRFGIAAADCPLATEILTGDYRIECQVGQVFSQRTVQVLKYTLPKFQVAVTLDEPFYQPGGEVAGSIAADYFFGQPVAGAEATLLVHATDVGRHKITELNLKTNAKGKADFRFTLPDRLVGREQHAGDAKIELTALVTDSAGQSFAAAASRIVTSEPIRVELIPEGGTLVRGVPNRIYVFTSYADGRPAPARLAIAGVPEELTSSRLGVASFDRTPADDTETLTVKATELAPAGRVGRRSVRFVCGQPAGDFLVRTDKAVYDGGETVTITALGGGVEPVMIDLLRQGQTILTRSIPVSNGRGEYAVDLPADVSGTLELVAYRYASAGLPVCKSRVLYVRPAQQLKIAATLDQPEYRPGQAAKLRLRLTDEAGQPVAGAVSLAVVDQAVFSVLAGKGSLEATFFLIEQNLLEPIYTLYNWSPDAPFPAAPGESGELPLVERERFEQALFARTAQTFADPALTERSSDNLSTEPDRGVSRRRETAAMAEAERRSLYTLAASSFPARRRDVSQRRAQGLAGVATAWFSLATALVLIGLGTFAVLMPRTFAVLAVLGCVSLGGLVWLVSSTQSPMAGGEKFAMVAAEAEGVDAAQETGAGNAMAEPFDMPDAGFEGIEPTITTSDTGAEADSAAPPPRVRERFPETLLWLPEVITDESGAATVEIDLADSITTWRLSASAVSADGRLGGSESSIRVFQPFFVDLNLPVALTRGDRVAVPVVVYNYLQREQTVELALRDDDWFVRTDLAVAKDEDRDSDSDEENDEDDEQQAAEASPTLKLTLAPGEIRSLSFPIEVRTVGRQTLEVSAIGSGVSDALRRQIEVRPNGRPVEQLVSGSLDTPLTMAIDIPADAIPGSTVALVKFYPSTFSQLVEGLDAIFQMPHGCFEQTSSTTYPNVLALDYLQRTGQNVPAVEAKARQYIHIGYQRLISYEVPGGGFDWFGNPPAHETLTAYGLMEFDDMARVYDVDPALRARTRAWLLRRRQPDGSWRAPASMLDDGLASSVRRGPAQLVTTAYNAWALFGAGEARSQRPATLDYLASQDPDTIDSPYVLALVANALVAMQAEPGLLGPWLDRLETLKQQDAQAKQVWWQAGVSTAFHGAGDAADVETTALAALAMFTARQHLDSARRSLAWIVSQKDARGTWHSTQATVLALRALLAASDAPLGAGETREIQLSLGGESFRELSISPDQNDVVRQLDLSDLITTGNYQLGIAETTETGTGYQVLVRYHTETDAELKAPEPLSIAVAYDRQRLNVNDTVTATVTVKNNLPTAAPMVVLDLPIPGGFTIEPGELDELVGSRKIARYQITARQAIVYLRGLEPGEQLELNYRLRATMPVRVAVPAAAAYQYYDPAQRGQGKVQTVEVVEGT